VPDGEPFWIAFFTPRQLAAESMYAAASLGNVRQTRRRALRVLSGSDGMRRRQVLATATLAASYLPSSGAQRDPDSDIGMACDVLREALPVIGSLSSTRALDAVNTVRRGLSAYPTPAVRELEHDLHRCVTGNAS
jgi:hypothetical protein